MVDIGKFSITKVDGSVTYTELRIYKGEVVNDNVYIRTVETAYHNGGDTVRTTEKQYPISVLDAFTGEYDTITDKPVLDLTVLGSILQSFGITLQS